MLLRPATETVVILRCILAQMEHDPVFDPDSLAALKRNILQRIAELELESALASGDRTSAPPTIAA